jgi:hypothetical protein
VEYYGAEGKILIYLKWGFHKEDIVDNLNL